MNPQLEIYLKMRQEYGLPDLVGCSTEEINHLEQYFHVRLPALYKEYLWYFGEEDVQRINKFQALIDELLSEDPIIILPRDAFIFYFDNYDSVFFFQTDTSERDPPIYICIISTGKIMMWNKSFTEYLIDSMENRKRD